ncbi:MAG: GNAT family N-acetyltransferase [Actinomycetota bacterium]|nr:GNAT family N-acetyltransferase [Actinomycetota bacterium]
MADMVLRPVAREDMETIFLQMSDPESVRMAAFTAEDPGDRQGFEDHMEKVLSNPANTLLAIELEGRVVGTIGSYPFEGRTEVTYWIDRNSWGRGIATRALALLLQDLPTRPLGARAASDNAASLRVLEKAGFRVIGTAVSFAPGRGAEVEETILELGRR